MTLSSLWHFSKTTDDRGQPVGCHSFRAIQMQASNDPALVSTVDRITAEVLTHIPVWKIILVTAFGGTLIVASMVYFGSQPFHLEYAPALIIMSIVGLEWSRCYYRTVMPGLTRILVEEGICAGCAYPLEGLTEDSDGMLVCPECAASWRRSRIIRFVPIEKNASAQTVKGEFNYFWTQIKRGTDRRGIRDDRNSPRAVIALGAARKVRSSIDGDHRDRLTQVIKTLRPKGRPRRVLSSIFNLLLVAVIAFPFSLTNPLGSGLPFYIFIPLALIVIFQLISGITVLFSEVGRAPTLVRDEFLKLYLCPCCADDLQSQRPHDDGCTVCPECGAAWNPRPGAAA